MNLIVGLGNPGPEYSQTRHNLGFAVIDALVQSWGVSMTSNSKLHGFISKDIAHDAILLMPTTYMNNSGQAVKATMEYYNVPNLKPETGNSKLVIIHDDLDIPLGSLKIQPGGGGHGGHNGVRSVIQHSNSPDFIRFRLGIGRPPHPQIAPADWVLQKPSGQEAETLASLVNTAAHAIETLLQNGLEPTMNQYNAKAE